MNRKYYNCFSYNQMRFLVESGFTYRREMIHSKSKNTFWIFEKSEQLDNKLQEWSSGKSKESVAI